MKENETPNYTPLPNEIWRRIQFAVLPDYAAEEVHVEISNCGRLRTFSQMSRGNLIHGTMTRTRLTTIQLCFSERRTTIQQARFSRMQEELKAFRHDLKRRDDELAKMYKNGVPITKKMEEKLRKDKETYDEMQEMFRETTRKENETRKIRYGGYVHRFVAEYFLTRPSEEHSIVIHIDHDNENNHHTNLKWVTHEESVAHNNLNPNIIKAKERRSTHKINKSYKLNESKVKVIKKALLRDRPASEIAKQFGVSDSQIRNIRRGQSWADVTIDDVDNG